jgi:hypothetical protein
MRAAILEGDKLARLGAKEDDRLAEKRAPDELAAELVGKSGGIPAIRNKHSISPTLIISGLGTVFSSIIHATNCGRKIDKVNVGRACWADRRWMAGTSAAMTPMAHSKSSDPL